MSAHEVLHRKAKWARLLTVAPVAANYRLGSRFGWRSSRRTGRRTFHRGLDFAAPPGAAVQAVRAGTVFAVARNVRRRNGYRGYGNAVVLYHGDDDVWSFYAHLSRVAVKPGHWVWPGQVVGHVGATSNGSFPRMGAHLHFEVRRRTPQGEAPFPGAYGAHNLDPQQWLARRGVHYDRRGFLVLDQGPPAVMAAGRADAAGSTGRRNQRGSAQDSTPPRSGPSDDDTSI